MTIVVECGIVFGNVFYLVIFYLKTRVDDRGLIFVISQK